MARKDISDLQIILTDGSCLPQPLDMAAMQSLRVDAECCELPPLSVFDSAHSEKPHSMGYDYRVEEYQCQRCSWESSAFPLLLMDTGTTAEAAYLRQMDTDGWELVSVVNTQWEEGQRNGGIQVLFRAFYWKRLRTARPIEEP